VARSVCGSGQGVAKSVVFRLKSNAWLLGLLICVNASKCMLKCVVAIGDANLCVSVIRGDFQYLL
jgi:hypothetical protein